MTARYRTIKVNGKTKLYHRHVMERHLGRPLATNEHVHHINGDRWDNRLCNLEVLKAREHLRHHKQRHPREKQCQVCDTTFTPAPTKRKRAKTCSPECANELRSRTERKTKALVRANVVDVQRQRASA